MIRPSASHRLEAGFVAWIDAANYPCLGAKSALSRDQIEVVIAADLRNDTSDAAIHAGLVQTVARYRAHAELFRSFVVIFETAGDHTEGAFERALWERLQALTDLDRRRGYDHDKRVCDDPEEPDFSLSFGGEAFYAIGLHPNASRLARRFSAPAIVFNIHDQFVRLRASGVFDGLSEAINARDIALCGSKNPMLGRHGDVSEARQYSGRAVDEAWHCPLHRTDSETLP